MIGLQSQNGSGGIRHTHSALKEGKYLRNLAITVLEGTRNFLVPAQ